MTIATCLVFLMSAVAPAVQTALQPAVIFVCEHGAAKSVIATAYFNTLARDRGLGTAAGSAQHARIPHPACRQQ
jgi:hypothetical protein